ncbi:glycosyltransferase [Methylobacterium sp. J-068]|uniref:glycosyltransferase n=1 Tax=Methylobacterium sp. J-068 TaxID=2836649 RepID=UPI001FB8C0BB|nr:glycosyltransferase [Methylobacterium sp. J-068]MCJ2034089.1 glycosyltransferase [Methylobacterium sp. J-068]
MSRPAILVVAPMPPFPTSAGNRRRLLTTCAALQGGGFDVDLATYAHEDQVYRRFGQHPPTDEAAAAALFRHTFRIEPAGTIPLTTRARCFGIDDWCPGEVDAFVDWYGRTYPDTRAILMNYVFLSRALEAAPPGFLKLIDTHDRFADRQHQYRPFRAEPNFFYTDRAGEAAGLARADIALAIQSEEAAYFRTITARRVHLLPPRFPARRPFTAPARLARIGFIGHGNDPNLFSIRRFAAAWAEDWAPGRPELVIAGEIGTSLGQASGPGLRLMGYVPELDAFYDAVDLVVAPMLMGSGLKMKVAEALSFGKPVIGTALGFEGFQPVIPEHRGRTSAEVKEQVLALTSDADGLARLSRACADLFAGYNARAEAAETDLLALLRSHPTDPAPGLHGSPLPDGEVCGLSGQEVLASSAGRLPDTEVTPDTLVLAGGTLTRETSLRSNLTDDPDLGRLVATERDAPPGAGPYSPLRRRWFAKVQKAQHGKVGRAGATPDHGLAGLRLALSPEWVRDPRLPDAFRAELATHLAALRPDWEAEARLVGLTGSGAILALSLPRHLATGPHPNAAFLVSPTSRALTLERVTPLTAAPALAYATARADLPPAPACLTFAGVSAPPGPATILFLHDDLVGRIRIAAPAPDETAS